MHTTALMIIDLQNDYFPGGSFPLPGAAPAGAKAAQLLAAFRQQGRPVVHVQHESLAPGSTFFLPDTEGVAIHASVRPQGDETVIIKQRPNSFLGTGLEALLRERGIKSLVVCGMMTNMCVDAGVRAASDMGFACQLVHDACAAADLSFGGVDVPAAKVHAAFVAALGFGYAQVVSCEEYLAGSA
ncbi:MAG: cysteine hydrolase [Proteobacteria bacterium]|nr:cysteine hydrolase [Pseudomonadota bacterium]